MTEQGQKKSHQGKRYKWDQKIYIYILEINVERYSPEQDSDRHGILQFRRKQQPGAGDCLNRLLGKDSVL